MRDYRWLSLPETDTCLLSCGSQTHEWLAGRPAGDRELTLQLCMHSLQLEADEE